MKKRIAIYGLYEGARCVYVGQSRNPIGRRAVHLKARGAYGFRVLRWVSDEHRARQIEGQVMRAYWARGEAMLNRDPVWPVEIWAEGRGTFYSFVEAQRAMGCCRNSIKVWAQEGFWYGLDGKRAGRLTLKRN